MELFLMVACLGIFGLAITCIAFGAATSNEQTQESVEVQREIVAEPARFFGDRAAAAPAPMQPRIPVEALLLQIENHVRLEQAAAQSFLESPTPAMLHGRTVSTFVN